MRFKTETKMRIQALKYRDGLENHQIAREMGISQTMIWQYIESLEKQIKAGEITVADIVSSCNTLKIEGPKKVRKQEAEDKIWINEASSMTDQQVDEMLSEQGMTQQELSENVQALDDAVAKAGKPDSEDIGFDEISATQYQLSEAFQSRCGIVKPIKGHEPDGGNEMAIPIKKQRRGGRQRQIVEIDGEPANKKMKEPKASSSKQSDYVLTIMGHIYDELVAGRLALKYYLMEDGVHELQFVEVRKK